jgi:hypothetical protein
VAERRAGVARVGLAAPVTGNRAAPGGV